MSGHAAAGAAEAAGAWWSWARPGRPAQPSAARIAPCSAVALRLAYLGRPSAPRRRRELRAWAGGRRLGAAQPEFRQLARQPEAFRPDVRVPASRRRLELASGLELRRELASVPDPDVRTAGSGCRRLASAWLRERVWHQEPVMVILQPGACRGEVRRGGQPAVRQVCCPEPALRSAQVLASVRVSPSEREWPPAQASRDGPQAQRVKASPWAQA